MGSISYERRCREVETQPAPGPPAVPSVRDGDARFLLAQPRKPSLERPLRSHAMTQEPMASAGPAQGPCCIRSFQLPQDAGPDVGPVLQTRKQRHNKTK